MGWTFLWMMVVLKIPVAGLLYIVWWAVKAEPDPAGEGGGSDGGSKRRHPRPPLPRHPRRGPHGDPLPVPPARVRRAIARSRSLDR